MYDLSLKRWSDLFSALENSGWVEEYSDEQINSGLCFYKAKSKVSSAAAKTGADAKKEATQGSFFHLLLHPNISKHSHVWVDMVISHSDGEFQDQKWQKWEETCSIRSWFPPQRKPRCPEVVLFQLWKDSNTNVKKLKVQRPKSISWYFLSLSNRSTPNTSKIWSCHPSWNKSLLEPPQMNQIFGQLL